MNIGIIGPARSGKTTTFHLLTGTLPKHADEFKREVQHGTTHVPDTRVDRLAEMSNSKKSTYVTVDYLDTPPLDAGASKSEWFTAAMEGGVKHSEALLLVVRAFGADEISSGLDPLRDISTVQEELVLADMIILEKRIEKLDKQRRVKPLSVEEKLEHEVLARASEHLSAGKPLRTLTLEHVEKKMLRGFQFISEKPLLALVNAGDDTLQKSISDLTNLNSQLQPLQIHAIALSAKLEGEIANLPAEEQTEFMDDIGVHELARDRVLRASFEMLGLQSFLTTGEKESRAWPMEKGGTAVDAAGVIHTDLAHGFIRAEVVHYNDFVREGGYPGCKQKGLLRLEGKEYIVKDGDILLIRHSG
ncbi:redox-regulated ATPase YchF [candidate division KSB1 bacterium]|nr:MAG: redox-regulated ATPase YchF [candidate division KSB1 bacterium]